MDTPKKKDENRFGNVLAYISGEIDREIGSWLPGTAVVPKISRFWRHGLLLKTTKYDSTGKNIEETTYNYKYDHKTPVEIKCYTPYKGNFDFLFEYKWESQPVLLASTETKYLGNTKTTVKAEYIYENNDWMAPASTVQTDAEGNQIKTMQRYAHNLTHMPTSMNSPTKSLVSAGILAPIETVTYRNNAVVSAELAEYDYVPLANNPAAVLPKRKYYLPLQSPAASITSADYNGTVNLVYDSRYKLSNSLEYDSRGNVLTSKDATGHSISSVYDRYGVNVATVTNAAYTGRPDVNGSSVIERNNQVYYTSFESEENTAGKVILSTYAKTGRYVCNKSWDIPLHNFIPGSYILTYWKSTDLNPSRNTWQKVTQKIQVTQNTGYYTLSTGFWIDEVSILPREARIKTSTYLPGVGKTSETDHNEVTTYWEYDDRGRVVRMLDNERRMIKEYEYHIKN